MPRGRGSAATEGAPDPARLARFICAIENCGIIYDTEGLDGTNTGDRLDKVDDGTKGGAATWNAVEDFDGDGDGVEAPADGNGAEAAWLFAASTPSPAADGAGLGLGSAFGEAIDTEATPVTTRAVSEASRHAGTVR